LNRAGTVSRLAGYPKLREHLGATVAYMTVSDDYPSFIKTLDAHRPRFQQNAPPGLWGPSGAEGCAPGLNERVYKIRGGGKRRLKAN
jgi:hypothetical protein